MARSTSKPPLLTMQSLGYDRADKRIDILQHVELHGSISAAARAVGVSYKAAWQALHTLSGLAGEPVVDGSVGGRGGGGARLTPAGQRLLQAAGLMDEARRQVLARVNAGAAEDAQDTITPGDASALSAPRTSMRNMLRCTVHSLHSAGARDPLVRVQLQLPGGDMLASRITRESAELLALAPGLPVLALCKATAVRILPADAAVPEGKDAHLNRLSGRIARIARGVEQDEATLLIDQMPLSGFAERPNRLRTNGQAQAVLDESALVIFVG